MGGNYKIFKKGSKREHDDSVHESFVHPPFKISGSAPDLQMKCSLPTLRYNTGYPNELLRVKKRLCTLLSFAI